MKAHEIIAHIEKTALPQGAAEWDHSGTQIAGMRRNIRRIAVALDPTLDTIDRALAQKADFILTHHPLSMKPKFLDVVDDYYRIATLLLKEGVWLYGAHTSLDANQDGPVGWLARELALQHPRTLAPTRTLAHTGFAFTLPENTSVAQWKALHGITSFRVSGTMAAVTCVDEKTKSIVQEKITEDCAEKPVYYPIEPETGPTTLGFGCIGTLPEPLDFSSFTEILSDLVERDHITVSGPIPGTISTVGYCTGSGGELAERAFSQGADVFITGDVKYHTALDATACIIDVGHFSLEEEMMRRFALRLAEELYDVEILFLPAQDPLRLRQTVR